MSKLYNLVQLIERMKAEDPDEARFTKNRLIGDLKKRKRTALNIATAQYGAHLPWARRQGEDNTALLSVQNGIIHAEDFYAVFDKAWTNYCDHCWTENIYAEDYLKPS